ncbi:MAG: hypothetical protein AAGH71_01465 [Planctomycetota bacterium]
MIAYAIPGFVLVSALSTIVPEIKIWLVGLESIGPNIAGFLFSGTSSIAAGLVVSAIRWAFVDSILHRTGLRPPSWEDPEIHQRLNLVSFLVDAHYRYYQFYANTAVSGMLAIGLLLIDGGAGLARSSPLLMASILTVIVLFAASRDALAKYYRRMSGSLRPDSGSPPT